PGVNSLTASGRLVMVALTADDTMLLKDVGLFIEPVEVYDTAGKLLGRFVPANLERCKELQERALSQIDWAKIERRRLANEPGEPFEVVRQRLQLLDEEIERRKTTGENEMTAEDAVAFMECLRRQNAVAAATDSGDLLAENGRRGTP